MEVPVTVVPLEGAHWEWLKRRASPVLCQDTTGFVAMRGDRIVGAVAFDSWSHNSCLSHIAIEDPRVVRRLVRIGCEFVFQHSGRGVLTGLTPADNEEALRLNKGLGFEVICRIRDGYRIGVDYVLQELRRENCRWIKPELRKAA